MRRTCRPLLTASVLALGLLAGPVAALPTVTAASLPGPTAGSTAVHAGSAVGTTAGSAATAGDALLTPLVAEESVRRSRTRSRAVLATRPRTARPAARAAAKPAGKPAVKAAPKPVAKPAAKPVAKPAAKPQAVAPAPRAGAYAFLQLDAGRPVRWNPCADVPWHFNPAGAPAGGLSAVQAAVREIGKQTGLRFAYLGTTTTPVNGAYLQQAWTEFEPLLVGWTSADASDLLAGRGSGTVGMARVLWTGSYDSTGANRTQLASGVVALNRATSAPATGPGSWFTYALHELGHAVGLDHVTDSTQIMNPVISSALRGYGTGDAAGLAKVGAGQGCLPDIR